MNEGTELPAKVKLEYSAILGQVEGNVKVFSYGSIAAKNNFTMWEYTNGFYVSTFGVETNVRKSSTTTIKHKVVLDRTSSTNYNFYVNDELVRSGTGTLEQASSPMLLLGSANRYVGKIYYLKLWVDDTLTYDLVPAKRNSDNEVGMYDLATGTFYTNAGTGSFIAGPDIVPTPDNPIEIESVGEKTKNLVDINTDARLTYDGEAYVNNVWIAQSISDANSTPLRLEANKTYYIHYELSTPIDDNARIYFLDENGKRYEKYNRSTGAYLSWDYYLTPTSPIVRWGITGNWGGTPAGDLKLKNFIIAESKTPVSYEPYGKYRIPIIISQSLPEEYQKVEYIESTGTQYLNINYKPNPKTIFELDMQFKENANISSSSANNFFIGTSINENAKYTINFGDGANEYNTIYYWIENPYDGRNIWSKTYSEIFNRSLMRLSNNNVEFLDHTRSVEEKTTTNTGNLIIGGNANSSNIIVPFNRHNMKIYDLKIYENSDLKINLIPCYRKSDNVIGLYDLVEGKFYTNQGTGTFLKGNDLAETIESTETRIVDKELNIYLDEPLRKIGDYADYIDFKNKKVVRNIKELILNGSDAEMWHVSYNASIKSGDKGYYASGVVSDYKDRDKVLVNMVNVSKRWGNTNICFLDGDFNIEVDETRFPTVRDLKTYISTKNIIVNYTLATPTEETIDIPSISTIPYSDNIKIGTNIKPSKIELN